LQTKLNSSSQKSQFSDNTCWKEVAKYKRLCNVGVVDWTFEANFACGDEFCSCYICRLLRYCVHWLHYNA